MNVKLVRIGIAALPVCLLGIYVGTWAKPMRRETTAATRRPVIVELFTAEGCSSCPPADTLLAKLAALQPVRDAEVIPLEEHVDYWNDGGWIDQFSSYEWTARQKDYVNRLKAQTAYTPQMVVDGESQFVGSNGPEALKAIAQAASGPSVAVELAADSAGSEKEPRFQVKVGALSDAAGGDQADVWLAVTEDGLHSDVTGGENAGHELHHSAVVRVLHKLGAASAGKSPVSFQDDAAVKLKSDWKRENLRVVVFVQEKKTLRIIGAASAKIAG